MNDSCCTYEWFISHIFMNHVTYMIQSWHTYEWVMSHIWMSHANLVCLHMWHDSFACVTYSFIRVTCLILLVTWLIHMSHDSSLHVIICVTWLIHMCNMTHSYMWHDSFICVTRLIHTCDVTHSYIRHDFGITREPRQWLRATWLIDMGDMTRSTVCKDYSYVWYHLFMCVTCLIYTCNMTHVYVWHDSFMCVTWLIHMCDMTHS